MDVKTFENEILFKLYEFYPGKWELIGDKHHSAKSICFEGKPTGWCLSWQCLETISQIPNPELIINKTVGAVMQRMVDGPLSEKKL